MDKLHQHFETNIKAWLKNPHIHAAHTSPNYNEDTKNKINEYLHNIKHDPSLLKKDTPTFISQHDNNDWALFLYVDDVHEQSVVDIKKSIEQEGHVVHIVHQQNKLMHEVISYGSAFYYHGGKDKNGKERTGFASVGITVKDKGGHTHLLTSGHIAPKGSKIYADAELKLPFATITDTVVGGDFDVAICTLENESKVGLCPDEFIIDNHTEVEVSDSVEDPGIGATIVFHGRSGVRKGLLKSKNWSGKITDDHGVEHHYTNCIQIGVNADETSQPGDSGSAYFQLYKGKAYVIGLHISGTKEKNENYAIAAPIRPTLHHFGLADNCIHLQKV